MIRFRFLLPLLALLLLLTGLSANPYQRAEGGETFSNGHTLQEPFLSFYRNAPDPELLFGLPITEPIQRDAPRKVVMQFFERARMEYDPDLPSDKQVVTLANIGSYVYDKNNPGVPADFAVNNSVCRSFPPDGYLVCYTFLQFYDGHNGQVYFGQPISNAEWQNGRMVQYFERARMEWWPERRAGQHVVLTELGRIDFDIRVGDSSLLDPQPGGIVDLPQVELQLQAYGFVEKPLLASGQSQKVYVVVRDQTGHPVKDVQVMITLIYPLTGDNKESLKDSKRGDATDDDGLSVVEFIPDSTPPNKRIMIDVEVTRNGKTVHTWTWFRTWW